MTESYVSIPRHGTLLEDVASNVQCATSCFTIFRPERTVYLITLSRTLGFHFLAITRIQNESVSK